MEVGWEPWALGCGEMSVEWGGPGRSFPGALPTAENLLENLNDVLGLVPLQYPVHVFVKA